MDRKEPEIVIEGIEEVIKKDLKKHQAILERSKLELIAYKNSRSHEIQKKKKWKSHIGGGKFNDDALRESMDQIAINIRHMSDKVDLTNEAIKHHTEIVDTLIEQLDNQMKGLKTLAKYRKEHQDASSN
jgi:hypothetical protein